jgi:hypothetical protein
MMHSVKVHFVEDHDKAAEILPLAADGGADLTWGRPSQMWGRRMLSLYIGIGMDIYGDGYGMGREPMP